MNPTLWHLCQREALLALRDLARQEYACGNPHAGHVVSWLDRVLAQPMYALLGADDVQTISRESGDRRPHRCRPQVPAPTRMQ